MSISGEINCKDPQFLDMFQLCLNVDISAADRIIQANKAQMKQLRRQMQDELARRKELKDRAGKIEDNILMLRATLERLDERINEASSMIKSVAAAVDDGSRLMSFELRAQKDVLDTYERTWREYQSRYEELPLAKARREVRIELEKVRIKRMMAEQRGLELARMRKQWERICWLRMRSRIVDFARAMLDNIRMDDEIKELDTSIALHREELQITEAQLAAERAKKQQEERIRTQKILEMPPPKINISHTRYSVYTRRKEQTDVNRFRSDWRTIKDSSMDSISVNTMLLEELCMNEEESLPIEASKKPMSANSTPRKVRESPIGLGQGLSGNEPTEDNEEDDRADQQRIIYEEYEKRREEEIRIEVDIRPEQRPGTPGKRGPDRSGSNLQKSKRSRSISVETSPGNYRTPVPDVAKESTPFKGSSPVGPRVLNVQSVQYGLPGLRSRPFFGSASNMSFDPDNFSITKGSSLRVGGSMADESLPEFTKISSSLNEMNESEAESIPRTRANSEEETGKDFSKFFSTEATKKSGNISVF